MINFFLSNLANWKLLYTLLWPYLMLDHKEMSQFILGLSVDSSNILKLQMIKLILENILFHILDNKKLLFVIHSGSHIVCWLKKKGQHFVKTIHNSKIQSFCFHLNWSIIKLMLCVSHIKFWIKMKRGRIQRNTYKSFLQL